MAAPLAAAYEPMRGIAACLDYKEKPRLYAGARVAVAPFVPGCFVGLSSLWNLSRRPAAMAEACGRVQS